ncbi:MAG: dethiobiotin synthase [Candidatus Binataceae bacterium]
MKRRFLISGTDTGVGKTTIAAGLAFSFQVRAMRVGVMKPVETGCAERDGVLIAADAEALHGGAAAPYPLELVCPFRYRAPLAPAMAAEADGLAPPDFARILEAYRQIDAQSDVMIVEGAGGLAVPITWEKNYADLALGLNLELVLIVPNRLGSLNAAILSLDYAKRRGIEIAGYVLNDADPGTSPAMETNAESLRRLTSIPCLGALKHKAPLNPEIAQRLL